MKFKLLILTTGLTLSSLSHAALNGPDGSPWKASADTPNSAGHSGIVVTDQTYSQCVTQFQNAMASHAYYHGDTFTNIKYCHYNPGASVIGGVVEKQLAEQIATLEDDYNIDEYLQKKQQIIKNYEQQLEVLPEAPRKTISK